MTNDPIYKIWFARFVFFALSIILILAPLTPIDMRPTNSPQPDLLFAVGFAVVLRRPDLGVFWLLALIFLLGDILRSEAIGLWAAISLVGSEAARNNRRAIQENLFIGEWASFIGIFVVCVAVKSIVETLFLIPTMGFVNALFLILYTSLAYPLVLFIIKYVFKVRRPRPSDYDQGIQSL